MNSSSADLTFVTGATGLIGSHVVRYLLALGKPVAALYRPENGYGLLTDVAEQLTWHEGDLLDIPSLEAAITPGCAVIHCAAIVSFVPRERARMEQINVEGTANLVNVCLVAGARKLAYLSSVAALGRPEAKKDVPTDSGSTDVPTDSDSRAVPVDSDSTDVPTDSGSINTATGRGRQAIVITEDQKWEDSPMNSAYAKTKYRAELEVWRGNAEGLPVVMVNPTIVLGEGDWNRSSTRLIKYVYDENRFYTDGDINYVDVLDVAEVIVKLLHSPVVDQRFILNAGTLPYHQFLTRLAQVLGKRPPTVRVPPQMARVLAALEGVRSWLLGTSPLVTRETARGASHRYAYPGQRITQVIDFQYRPLNQTLQRIAGQVARRESI